MPDTDIRILDDQDDDVPIGERGKLVVKGPQVTQGYYQQPEATSAAFTTDGYFRTGDIAIKDDEGRYEIVDRKKDMIIVSGFNVYPNEVKQIAAKCDGVQECACIGVSDENAGEAVKVFAVKSKESEVSEADIIAHCREYLTVYKVPKTVVFIMICCLLCVAAWQGPVLQSSARDESESQVVAAQNASNQCMAGSGRSLHNEKRFPVVRCAYQFG